jgi:hypothetical protein
LGSPSESFPPTTDWFSLGVIQRDPHSSDNRTVDTNDPEVLTLICPMCGAIFPSAMQMDPRTFENIRLDQMLERCRACGSASRFKKSDYLFRSR